jgi:hypothetical protein
MERDRDRGQPFPGVHGRVASGAGQDAPLTAAGGLEMAHRRPDIPGDLITGGIKHDLGLVLPTGRQVIIGLWFDGSVWDKVAAQLEARGHHAVPVTLPGQGDGNALATLADQVAAVVVAVDAAASRPMVVGHSAACSLAWLADDARPGEVSKVALIGGLPVSGGELYADLFPIRDSAMAFPGWSTFEGPDSADLDDAARHPSRLPRSRSRKGSPAG